MAGKKRIILILGGARGGKSTLAERLARRCGQRIAFVATAAPGDPEMSRRISAHVEGRPATWATIEEHLYPSRVIGRLGTDNDAVIVDCLTLLVSNYLMDALPAGGCDDACLEERVLSEVTEMLDRMDEAGASFILVSNEVGMGLVPPYPVGRRYRDLLGVVNQMVASRADEAYLLVAGIPIDLKRFAASFDGDRVE